MIAIGHLFEETIIKNKKKKKPFSSLSKYIPAAVAGGIGTTLGAMGAGADPGEALLKVGSIGAAGTLLGLTAIDKFNKYMRKKRRQDKQKKQGQP